VTYLQRSIRRVIAQRQARGREDAARRAALMETMAAGIGMTSAQIMENWRREQEPPVRSPGPRRSARGLARRPVRPVRRPPGCAFHAVEGSLVARLGLHGHSRRGRRVSERRAYRVRVRVVGAARGAASFRPRPGWRACHPGRPAGSPAPRRSRPGHHRVLAGGAMNRSPRFIGRYASAPLLVCVSADVKLTRRLKVDPPEPLANGCSRCSGRKLRWKSRSSIGREAASARIVRASSLSRNTVRSVLRGEHDGRYGPGEVRRQTSIPTRRSSRPASMAPARSGYRAAARDPGTRIQRRHQPAQGVSALDSTVRAGRAARAIRNGAGKTVCRSTSSCFGAVHHLCARSRRSWDTHVYAYVA
jgi:hypothetical protein